MPHSQSLYNGTQSGASWQDYAYILYDVMKKPVFSLNEQNVVGVVKPDMGVGSRF